MAEDEPSAGQHGGRAPSLLGQATCWQLAVFSWMQDLLFQGRRRVLGEQDMPELHTHDTSTHLYGLLERCWDAEKDRAARLRREPSLARALLMTFGPSQGPAFFYVSVECACKVLQAVCLGHLINSFNRHGPQEQYKGYLYGTAVVLGGLGIVLSHHHFYFRSWRLGMQMRTVFTAAIYNKALRLPLSSFLKLTSGHVVNLASTDVERFLQFGIYCHYLLVSPIECLFILYFGMAEVGWPFAVGLAALLLLAPLQYQFGKRFASARLAVAVRTDERMKLTSQAVTGARIMHIMGWEPAFTKRISEVRRQEVKDVLVANRLRGLNEAIFFASPAVIAFLTFSAHVYLAHKQLTPGTVFSVLTLFNIVQMDMCKFFSSGVATASEASVALQRLRRLMVLEERTAPADRDGNTKGKLVSHEANHHVQTNGNGHVYEGDAPASPKTMDHELLSASTDSANGLPSSRQPRVSNGHHDPAIVLEGASFTWAQSGDNATPPVLTDMHLKVERRSLVVVIGEVGASKSSLLLALLAEVRQLTPRDTCRVNGTVTYASQEAWIMSGSIRQNILFGKPFVERTYYKVLSACSLITDLQCLAEADHTVVGDRGVTLSGGQRARIGLARAAYAALNGADLCLLDDPLSAVDPAVGKHLFQRVICGLLRHTTRILVTHQQQYLHDPCVTTIVVLKKGRVAATGDYDALRDGGYLGDRARGSEASLDNDSATAVPETNEEMRDVCGPDADEDDIELVPQLLARTPVSAGNRSVVVETRDKETGEVRTNTYVSLMAEEESGAGVLSWRTYTEYARHMGGVVVVIGIVALLLLAQVASMGANLWLSQWSRLHPSDQNQLMNLWVFLALTAAAVVLSWLRAEGAFMCMINASQRLHDRMLARLLRAPCLFFDSNPAGRILNRFSKDVGYTDDLLPATIFDFAQCACLCLGVVVLVVVVNPYLLILLVPLAWAFSWLRTTFLLTSREAKRLESIARSPVYAFLSETMEGLATIRSFSAVEQFKKAFNDKVDASGRPYFVFVATARWLGFRLDVLCFVLLVATTYSALILNDLRVGLSGWLLGVSMMYLLQLAGFFQWTVRQSAEVTNQMISVERILQYCQIEQEAPLQSAPDKQPPPHWPQHAEIVAEDAWAKYRSDLKPVLQGLSFHIRAGEKVGIVGRTGAGKSSLIAALFRLMELHAGKIVIDGVDISNVGLHDLRRRISAIPQVPFLFSGTVRDNMDPFSSYTDDQIWRALESVQIKDVIAELPGKLSASIGESGSNLSVGQRQLLCLARAILQQNKLLIMDEATANVDLATDTLIQKAIRERFTGFTVLMVAHRLATIIDCDKVLVLNDGQVVEYGHPHELITNGRPDSKSSFLSMVNETGAETAQQLKEVAYEAWCRKQTV